MSISPGDLLKRSRFDAGLSQREVARNAKLPQPAICSYELGHRTPSVHQLEKLLAATNHTLILDVQPTCDTVPSTCPPIDTDRTTCSQCGYEPSTVVFGDIARVNDTAQALQAALTSDPASSQDQRLECLWHLVDVVRFDTDLLTTITVQPGTQIADRNDSSSTGTYRHPRLPLETGLAAFRVAVNQWATVAMATPLDNTYRSPNGPVTGATTIQRTTHEIIHHTHSFR